TAAEWLEIMRANGVPVARVAEFQDLPDDPQVLANDMAMRAVEDLGMARIIRDPVNVDGLARVGPKKAPALGEHSDEILGELGYGAEHVARLREAGVI
ncbi:MAG: CoA transferase, partial [Gammaproteobacteria bacterium]